MIKEATESDNVNRNNLDKSSSPYLLQHLTNPVWWQEWSQEVVQYALKEKKPLFVSVGYATCHWCHVMSAGAFSDKKTAGYLNDHFICVKVDREQRPDIDQFLMRFINTQNGSGGWPLNVFLTPDLRPIFALTYAPASSDGNSLSFLNVAEKVHEYYQKKGVNIPPFIPGEEITTAAEESTIGKTLRSYFDPVHGGFGNGQKFPPHTTLLYMLYFLSVEDNTEIKTICTKTLDSIRLLGLNDHLQGGIFRYCVDPGWTIPHFEKMLYDQAMALWYYSLAFRVIGKNEYKIMADNVLRCLDECFAENGLYVSAHNADTEHAEGATYLWSYEQLRNELLPEEFKRLSETYNISKTGNFDDLNHLVRKNDIPLKDIEDKLLSIRNTRKQPSRDDKILCGINALVAIAMIQAGRFLEKPDLEEKASLIIHNLLSKFWDGTTLGHSYFNNVLQKQSFLFDAAAMLTAVTMLSENDDSWSSLMTSLAQYVKSFNDGDKWTESDADDFQRVYASWFDHPVPSSVSLAVMGLTREAILSGKEIPSLDYRQPFESDFFNLAAMVSNGRFHIYTFNKFVPWSQLPVNSILIRGENETDCYMGTCTPLSL